jgi:hypothetical protein
VTGPAAAIRGDDEMTIHEVDNRRNRPPDADAQLLEELRATRAEISALRKLFDHFAGTFLNAKFPFGKPTDRWARR